MAMAQDHLDVYAVCYQKAVDRLHRVRVMPSLVLALYLNGYYNS